MPSAPVVARPVIPPLDPGVTMRSPVAPPPGKPDSVELLRKRTGTPRVGVPVHDAPPAGPGPVAGVIDAAATPAAAPLARPREAPPVARAADPGHVLPPTQPDDAQARGKRHAPASADLNISQVWYEEGEQLSADPGEDDPGARAVRARRTISPSVTDLSLYDERPRRRWGLLAGIGAFAVIGVALAFALTRGGRSTDEAAALAPRPQPSATAPIDAAPSTILATDPPATDVAAAPGAAEPAAAAPPPIASSPGKSVVAPTHRPVATRTSGETRGAARRAAESTPSFPVLGSEPIRRPPGPATIAPAVIGPAPGKPPTTPSLTDSPKDPYGGDDTPSDGGAPEKKAEFFSNLGGQQLIAGDTAGAASNFKKALELDAKNVAAATGMGEIALRQGLFGDAIAHLTKAARLSPKSAKVLTLLGEAYLSSGNSNQAAAQFKKALQLDPDNARARDGYNEASSRVAPPDEDAQ